MYKLLYTSMQRQGNTTFSACTVSKYQASPLGEEPGNKAKVLTVTCSSEQGETMNTGPKPEDL